MFSYTCHQNIIAITNELIQPTTNRVASVIATSVNMALAIYLVISISGYETFGPVVESDVLATYPSTALVAVARVAISIVVTFSYPLQSHPSRGCILSLIGSAQRRLFPPRGHAGTTSAAAASAAPPPPSLALHAAVTTAFLLATTTIALVVTDLGVVLSLVGATGSTIVSYILPGTTYYLLCRERNKRWRGLLQLSLGLIIMPLSLALIVLKEMNKLP